MLFTMLENNIQPFVDTNDEPVIPLKVEPHHKVALNKDLIYSTSTLSPIAQKLFYCAVATIKKDDTDFVTFSLKVKDVREYFPNIEPQKLYQSLKKAVAELFHSAFYMMDIPTQSLMAYHIVRRIQYKRGEIIFRFDEDLRPYLLNLSGSFAPIPLNYWKKITSSNAMKLLEILYFNFNLQYNKSNKKPDFHAKITIPLHQLRYFFEGDMIECKYTTEKWGKSKYQDFGQFKSKVLEPSIEQINTSGVLHISPIIKEYDKNFLPSKWRQNPHYVSPHKVTAVTFIISKSNALIEMEETGKEERIDTYEFNSIRNYCYSRFYIPNDKFEATFKNLENEIPNTVEKLKIATIAMQSILNKVTHGMFNKRYAVFEKCVNKKIDTNKFKNPLEYLTHLVKDNIEAQSITKYFNRNYKDKNNYGLNNYIDETNLLNAFDNVNLLGEDYDTPDNKKEIDNAFKLVLKSLETSPNSKWDERIK